MRESNSNDLSGIKKLKRNKGEDKEARKVVSNFSSSQLKLTRNIGVCRVN